MCHGSCSELQLPRHIPSVAQFWRWAVSEEDRAHRPRTAKTAERAHRPKKSQETPAVIIKKERPG
jgi:hypothetical protein